MSGYIRFERFQTENENWNYLLSKFQNTKRLKMTKFDTNTHSLTSEGGISHISILREKGKGGATGPLLGFWVGERVRRRYGSTPLTPKWLPSHQIARERGGRRKREKRSVGREHRTHPEQMALHKEKNRRKKAGMSKLPQGERERVKERKKEEIHIMWMPVSTSMCPFKPTLAGQWLSTT